LKTKVVEKIKTQKSLFSITPPPPPIIRAVYETKWENVVEPEERTRMTVKVCAA
jgi:hypothetical protein